MSTKEKNDESKSTAVTDKIATTFAATEKSLSDIETRAAAARREVREQSESYANAQEARKREAEQWDYEEAQRRREVKDMQATEDRDRLRQHSEREAGLAHREKSFRETVAELLGIAADPFDPKAAKAALDKKLSDAETKGKVVAEKVAASEYATKKAIDEANAAKDLALLKSDNERYKSDNAKLEAECKRLSEINTSLATRSGDLALGAFQAAGGLQSKANESLQMAAQGQRIPGR